MNSILSLVESLSETGLNRLITGSTWLFPAIEGLHVVALALLFGAVVFLNLRLLGLTMRHRPTSELAQDLDQWTLFSIVLVVVTGALLFVAEPVQSFQSVPFRIKMVLLAVTLVFHYSVSRPLMRREQSGSSPAARMAAVFGIVLWVSVGLAGRAIGYF
jgi:uncharacterized membrane protein